MQKKHNLCSASLGSRGGFRYVVALLIGLLFFESVAAQNTPTAQRDAQIQNLYAEAKSAQAQGNLGAAAARYESLLKIAPELAPVYNNLGSIYLQMRNYRKAIATLQKGLQLDPKMTSAVALLGISRYQIADYAGALRDLEAALRTNPKDHNAELFLSKDLIKLGDFESAAVHLRQLSKRQPQNQEIWYLLGKVHMKLSEEALSNLNVINPDSVWVHEISGEAMEGMKNFDGALLEYKRAVELAPTQAGVHYALGNAYWSIHMWEQAKIELQAELQNDPANCTAQWKLGNIWLEQRQDSSDALAQLSNALTMCPNLMGARVDRGRALMRLDRNEEAVGELQIAERADPSEPSTHFLLAQALRATGRTREAQGEMQVFSKLEEAARDKTAERAKQLLQEKQE
jgi:tetratricopeptide (TPR) repeat protein